MKKTLLETYALAVCFASMICISISSGIVLYDLVEINYPEVTIESYMLEMPLPPPYPMAMHNHGSVTASAVNVDALPPEALAPPTATGQNAGQEPVQWGKSLFSDQSVERLSEQEIAEQKQKRVEHALKNEADDAWRSLIQMFIVLLVSSVVFFIHWRLAKKCSVG